MIRRLILAFALLVACVHPALAGGGTRSQHVQTMTFQNGVAPTAGYSGAEFTFIRAAVADTGKNYGAADTLYLSGAGYTGFRSGISKILGKFDISPLPDSCTIVDAKMYLYEISGATGSNSDTASVFRVFPPWTVGTGAQTGTASSASATWIRRHVNDSPADVYTSKNWATAGCSASPTGTNSRGLGTSDSTLAGTYTGTDTLDVKSSLVSAVDHTAESSLLFVKTGATANLKNGWWIVPMTKQVGLWHYGANTNNGFVIEMHNNANDKLFKFLDNVANKPYRAKLVVQYLDPEPLESSGTTVASNSRRSLGGGPGLH